MKQFALGEDEGLSKCCKYSEEEYLNDSPAGERLELILRDTGKYLRNSNHNLCIYQFIPFKVLALISFAFHHNELSVSSMLVLQIRPGICDSKDEEICLR